jgi:hypothetical protein
MPALLPDGTPSRLSVSGVLANQAIAAQWPGGRAAIGAEVLEPGEPAAAGELPPDPDAQPADLDADSDLEEQ